MGRPSPLVRAARLGFFLMKFFKFCSCFDIFFFEELISPELSLDTKSALFGKVLSWKLTSGKASGRKFHEEMGSCAACFSVSIPGTWSPILVQFYLGWGGRREHGQERKIQNMGNAVMPSRILPCLVLHVQTQRTGSFEPTPVGI